MRLIKELAWALVFIISGCSAENIGENWQGIYSYFGSAGTTVGGSQIMMDIKLKLDSSDPKSRCVLEMVGFQKNEIIYCDTTTDNSKLNVLFRSYEDGSMKNKYGIERYKVGTKLFTIERQGDAKDGKKYQPKWEAYSPFGDRTVKPDEYFEKSGTK